MRKSFPVNVRRSILDQNKEALSELGRRGSKVRQRRTAQRKPKEKGVLDKQLRGSEEMRREANEDICPVD